MEILQIDLASVYCKYTKCYNKYFSELMYTK